MRYFLTMAVLGAASVCAAGSISDLTFKCKVKNFEADMVNLSCDANKKDQIMRTPRVWLGDAAGKLKSGDMITMRLPEERAMQWLKMNQKPAAAKKEGKS